VGRNAIASLELAASEMEQSSGECSSLVSAMKIGSKSRGQNQRNAQPVTRPILGIALSGAPVSLLESELDAKGLEHAARLTGVHVRWSASP
jgi:hypothetical protein